MYTEKSLVNLGSHINLMQVLLDYLPCQMDGSVYFFKCPFHETEEYKVRVKEGFTHLYCEECDFNGDAVAFLMQHKSIGFFEAVEYLAQKFGITLEKMPKKVRGDDNQPHVLDP